MWWKFANFLKSIFYEVVFIFLYRIVPPDRLDILETREERCRTDDMRSAWLISVWESCGLIAISRDRVDRTSARKGWFHDLEKMLLPIEYADPCICHDFVSCSDEEVDPIFFYIDSKVWECLTAIDDEKWLLG